MADKASYNFDKQSIDRIGTSVRYTERQPNTDDNGSVLPEAMVPYQVQRFIPTEAGEWQWEQPSSGPAAWKATCYRIYYDDSEDGFEIDTTQEYTVYNDRTTDRMGREFVIAYHRHDVDRWEVVERSSPYHRSLESVVVPPYGVGVTRYEHTGLDAAIGFVTAQCPTGGPFDSSATEGGVLSINGSFSAQTSTDYYVPFSFAKAAPVRAAYAYVSGYVDHPVEGERWGPAPGSWLLWPNLPGFRCVGEIDETNERAMFIADTGGSFSAQANENNFGSSPTVEMHPDVTRGGQKYDGTNGMPTFLIDARIPGEDSPNLVNIGEDDILYYETSNSESYILNGCYRDVPIGTIMMKFVQAASRGWDEQNYVDKVIFGAGGSQVGFDLDPFSSIVTQAMYFYKRVSS